MGTILVLGATGTVGRPLVRTLVARGADVRAASRGGAAVEGAPGVAFDFADPAGWDAAFAGVDRVYLLAPAGTTDPAAFLLPVVAAAAERGAKIVFQSVLGAEADEANPYRRVERAIEASGRPHVILRPNWFADNFHTYWKAGVAAGRIAVPAAEGKSSFIDARDIADAAAAALTEDRFDGQSFDLTGPAALGYGEAADILSDTLGRTVTYAPVDDAGFVAALSGAGIDPDYARLLAAIFAPVREGWTAPVTGAVERITGHPARPLAVYAADNRAALAA